MDGNSLVVSVSKSLNYFSVAWNAKSTRPEDWRTPVMSQDSPERLVELTRYVIEIHGFYKLKSWRKLEIRISQFASEARFRLFEDREDSHHASYGATCDILCQTGFKLRDGKSWNDFHESFLPLLSSPVYDKPLLKCIRAHFIHD